MLVITTNCQLSCYLDPGASEMSYTSFTIVIIYDIIKLNIYNQY